MNCDHDDFGPVDMDKLMKAHYSRIYGYGGDCSATTGVKETFESTISNIGDSHECVGRKAYQMDSKCGQKDMLKPTNLNGRRTKKDMVMHATRTWAQVAAK
jgi:hypothetical protein